MTWLVPWLPGAAATAATAELPAVATADVSDRSSPLHDAVPQLTFFLRMCKLIAGTVGFSIVYALFFFMPLLALVGPNGTARSLVRPPGRHAPSNPEP